MRRAARSSSEGDLLKRLRRHADDILAVASILALALGLAQFHAGLGLIAVGASGLLALRYGSRS